MSTYRTCDLCPHLCTIRQHRVALVRIPKGVRLPESIEVVAETHEPCIAEAGTFSLLGLARKLNALRGRARDGS